MAIRMSGLASNMDTESIVKELMSAQRTKLTKIENKKTKLEWKQDKWKDLNTKIYSFYTSTLSKTKMQGSFDKKTATSSNKDKVAVESGGSAPEGNHSIKVNAVASSQYVTGAKLETGNTVTYDTKLTELNMTSAIGSTISVKAGSKDEVNLSITAETTVSDIVNTLQEAGLNASFDTKNQRFFISARKSGYENAFSLKASSTNVDLTKLGLSEITTTPGTNGVVNVSATSSNVTLVKPSDAAIVYNGAEITSSSNTITVNGLTVTVKGVTTKGATEAEDEVINITATNDVDAVYTMVKDFVKSYNELLKAMNEAYNAKPAKGYEPLTDEQKEAMSEDQEKQWENKIKDSLLRRDSTLGSISDSMKTIFARSVKIEGKSYSLSSFGIAASDYTENGLLHINGNSEDTLTASKTDSLKKALTENPESVMQVLTTLSKDLYSDLSEKMKSTELRSALTVYNDKEMKSTVTSYTKDISNMEDKLQDMETRYYRQFTAMETAMSKMNSQSSSLTSLLGGTSS